jgi:hypothetical protein
MSIINNNVIDSAGRNPVHYSDTEDLSSIIKQEFESIIEEIGFDEKDALLKKKIENALASLSNAVEEIDDYQTALDSFCNNLEIIIKNWDEADDNENRQQIEN